MNRLLIIGAGGLGRELLSWALDIPQSKRDWEIGGFLDSNPHALDGFSCAFPILDDPLKFELSKNDRLICAIAEPKTKLYVCKVLEDRGGQFISIIHPSVIIGNQCVVGDGCILCPGVVLTSDVTLGRHVLLNVYATIGHDVIVSDGCTLNAHSDVTGCSQLDKGVFMGSHACILPNVNVGEYSTIGAGSVVLRRVNPCTSVFGVPAKKIL